MRTSNHKLLLLAIAGVAIPALVEAAEQPVFRDAAKHEDLALQARKELAKGVKVLPRQFRPAEGADPSVEQRPVDLIKRSDIISFRGVATLVPKRAVLHVPEEYKSRVGNIGDARLVPWTEFFSLNRGWISIFEVDRATAEGRNVISLESTTRFKESDKLVVATLLKGPVSVAPPLEPEPSEQVAENENTEEP